VSLEPASSSWFAPQTQPPEDETTRTTAAAFCADVLDSPVAENYSNRYSASPGEVNVFAFDANWPVAATFLIHADLRCAQ
jgi:hypothetical protein